MPGAKRGKSGASAAGGDAKRRGPRRRTLLDLGIPFVPVDDFVNQAEDAVALGYRVLEQVVNEIKKGYDDAVKYNEKQREAEKAGSPPPPIPWQDVVARLQNLNAITLDAMKRGNEIFLDSVEAGIEASNSLGKTLAKTRTDTSEQRPSLAGPVFPDPLTVKFKQGQTGATKEWPIEHAGLARLRIHAQVSTLQQLIPKDSKATSYTLAVDSVTFEPAHPNDEKRSVLTVNFANIPDTQPAGRYEGQVTASNFDLLIARLQIEIEEGAAAPRAQRSGA